MKKTLLLFCALLSLCGGAWATNPASGAYPVEGKTYYFFANKYGTTDRYHLYWDNTNSVLKRANANTKENTDYYKWTVTVSDGKYYITNVGTGTKLAWDDSNGLTLKSSGSLFDLSQQVDYTACVSLYYSNFWCCVENSVETFRNGLKFSNSFPTTGKDSYSVDFVFEEVLSAHSLADGSYYTIYCDNDNKQYLYDNAGTLAQTSSAPASDLRYVWQCIVNGDYYNFRNLQTGKYLGWRALSASAYNYTITTTQAIHDGCATMWGNASARNWSIHTDGTLTTGQTSTSDNKIKTDWCTDFRFDEIDLSSWCTGDLLGGSMTGTNNYTNTWTSGTSPSFTLTASANNINNLNDRTTGGLDIRSGKALSSTYDITAPTGYLITGYTIVGYALSGDQTLTPSKGGDATVFTTTGNSISVSGLHQAKASFTLSGANAGLFIRALQVSLAPIPSSITSLPTANDKIYMIYNAVAVWNFANNATSMNAVELGNMDLDNEEQQIALIYHNENYYLYSVKAGKYLTADNTLTSVVTDNEQISITGTGNATYPWFFTFKNVANKNINIDGNRAVQINNYSTLDEGNRNAIIEADDFDATEALAMFDNRYVTYNLSYGGNSTFRTVDNVVVALNGNSEDYVPWDIPAYCNFTYDPETIEAETTEVNVTLNWNGPFEISANYESAVWYYVAVNGKWARNHDTKWTAPALESDIASVKGTDGALWAFLGNPFDGIVITLKEKYSGSEVYLSSGSSNPDFWNEEGSTEKWTVKKISATTFTLNCGDKYLIDNSNRMAFKTTTLEGSEGTFTVRSYYCQLALDNWAAYVGESTDKNFGVTPESATAVEGMITGMPNMDEATYNSYFATIPNANISGYITYNYPSNGCYRIKNNQSGRYMAWGKTSKNTDGALLTVDAANKDADLSTIFYLEKVSNTEYKLSTQGGYVQTVDQADTQVEIGSTPVTYNIGIFSPGIVLLQNDNNIISARSTTGHLMESQAWTTTDPYYGNEGVISWNSSNDWSKWVVEDASTATISLTVANDNTGANHTYATLCVPFNVTGLTGVSSKVVKAYTPTQSGAYIVTGTGATTIDAGMPVILIGEDADATSVTAAIGSSYVTSLEAPTSEHVLTGTFTGTNIDCTAATGTNYVLGFDATNYNRIGFYHVNNASFALKANRAYLNTDAVGDVKGFVINFDDLVDGIGSLTPDPSPVGEGSIYNLAGQRINRLQRGVNIVNGKKVIVK